MIDDLDVWFKNLYEILDKFIEIYDGKVDNTFWSQIYKGNNFQNKHIYVIDNFI